MYIYIHRHIFIIILYICRVFVYDYTIHVTLKEVLPLDGANMNASSAKADDFSCLLRVEGYMEVQTMLLYHYYIFSF